MREKVILPAVHDKDLIKLLEEFGLREKLERILYPDVLDIGKKELFIRKFVS